MPSRRPQPGGAAAPAAHTPRRSERIRVQREAAAIQALRVSNETTPTNASTIATHSHLINAPRSRSQRNRRWSGLDMARIRQVAAEALGVSSSANPDERARGGVPYSPPPPPAPNVGAAEGIVRPLAQALTSGFSIGNWASVVSYAIMGSPLRRLPAPPPGPDTRPVMGRLRRELHDFQRDPPEGCTVEVVNDNMFNWRATIPGPPETPYAGGIFHLDLHFGTNYPFAPPKIFFLTKIYHCNIASNGYICLDILSREWSPALSVAKLLLSIISLMSDPNPDDPLEPSIASMYKRQRAEHDVMATSWTARYAREGQEPTNPAHN